MSKNERIARAITILAGLAFIVVLMVSAGTTSKAAGTTTVTSLNCVVIDAPPVVLAPHVERWTKEKFGQTLVLTDEERPMASALFQLVTAPQAFIEEGCNTVTAVGLYTQPEETLSEAYAYTGFLILEARKKENK